MISQNFIDSLITQCDIVSLIDSYLPLKKAGRDYTACCPFHHEKTPSFYVIPQKQFYHCFGCGESGNALRFIMKHLNLPFLEAVQILCTRMGVVMPASSEHTRRGEQSKSLYDTLTQVMSFYQYTLKKDGQIVIDYLKRRGIDGLIAKEYQLGYAPDGWHVLEKAFPQWKQELIASGMLIQKESTDMVYDRYRQRVMFPIHNRQGKVIGFGGRAIADDQKPKYLNSPETVIFQKSNELYGLYQLLQHDKTPETILVVEGYMDVIALAQHKIPFAVATLGTALSAQHIHVLHKYTQKIVLCFDGDAAGQKAAHRALEQLLQYMDATMSASFIFLPSEHDPDSLVRTEGRDAFLSRMHTATPLIHFLEDILRQDLDMGTIAGKSALLARAKPFLHKIPEGVLRQSVLDLLASLTRMDTERIASLHMKTHHSESFALESHKTMRRTPLRVAIALVLQRPELAHAWLQGHRLSEWQGQIPDRLYQLLEIVQPLHAVTTGRLMEILRDDPDVEALYKLTSWPHHIPEASLEKEFADIVDFLRQKEGEKAVTELLAKSRREGLTSVERQRLQHLLTQRAQAPVVRKN